MSNMTMVTANDSAVYKGKALHVAEFLSTFQAHFRKGDEDRKGPISVKLIEQALEYRELLHERYNLENTLVRLEKDGHWNERQRLQWQENVHALKAKIESIPALVKEIHALLRRFEVRSTQSLANHVLTYCVEGTRDKQAICCSPLLNLPGAAHFRSHFPGLQDQNEEPHVCAIGVPANGWTWQEYLRICNTVSRLENPEDASKSTLTAASPVLIGQRREELKLSEHDELSPSDLVALWVRAQRNTSAWLHLMHLFKISEAPKEPRDERYSIKAASQSRGKILVIDDPQDSDSEEEEEEARYIAEYVGNHRRTRKHIKCSSLLDKIVEWAVTNQVLFSYRYIREAIPLRLRVQSEKKAGHKRTLSTNSDGESIVKRRKIIQCEDENEERKLLHACHCYLLRWFGRRNRNILSILFTSHQVPFFPYEALVQSFKERNVPYVIKKDLRAKFNAEGALARLCPGDRTFARIDRRVRIGKYTDEGIQNDLFCMTVMALLKSFASVGCLTAEERTEVEAACKDFENLCDTFFLSCKSATEAAEMLLDTGFDSSEKPESILLSFPEPWEDHCHSCQEALDGGENGTDENDFFQCSSCGHLYHNKCVDSCNVQPVKDLIATYGPLAQIYSAVPSEIKPEYRKVNVQQCPDCQVQSIPNADENRIFAEASWCKALISKIGMESYALPFHDEFLAKNNESDDLEGDTADIYHPQVSLRRLYAMMDYIATEHDSSISEVTREDILSSMGNPFLRAPWASSSEERAKRIEWVNVTMMGNPMQLLCKGIERLVLIVVPPVGSLDQWRDDRTVFLRQFTILFSSWFLCNRDRTNPFLPPSGRLSYALASRCPWVQVTCTVCRGRPSISEDKSEAPVCDNKCCQRLLSSDEINQRREEEPDDDIGHPATDGNPSTHSMTEADAQISSYDGLSSLVGSPILVLPGDPLLQLISEKLKSSIDHMHRPVIFVVASYLPHTFATSGDHTTPNDSEGVFHVLPIVFGEMQLKYLLDTATMRRPSGAYDNSNYWTRLDILDLPGIVRMSATQLRKKLDETRAIRDAVDSTVLAIAGGRTAADEERTNRVFDSSASAVKFDMMFKYSALIDSLLCSQDPLVHEMIGSLTRNASEDDSTDIDSVQSDVPAAKEDESVQPIDDVHIMESRNSSSGGQHVHEAESEPIDEETADAMLAALDSVTKEAIAPPVAPQGENRRQLPLDISPQVPDQTILPANRQIANPARQERGQSNSGQPMAQQPAIAQSPAQHGIHQSSSQLHGDLAVNDPSSHAGFITKQDLHMPGRGVLTRIETAFYLEAASRSLHSLGLRLLCPRYNFQFLREHLPSILYGDPIPRVQEPLWDMTLQLDYKRTLREPQSEESLVLVDMTGSEMFRYTIPFEPLPLDRITELFLSGDQEDRVSEHLRVVWSGDQQERGYGATAAHPLQARQSFEPPIRRIRGGGPSDERLPAVYEDEDAAPGQVNINVNDDANVIQLEMIDEPLALVETPRNLWQGTPIHLRLITPDGENREENQAIGVVGEVGDDNEDDIPVAWFYFSRCGYLDESVVQLLPAADLLVVQEGSNEYRLAREWPGFAQLERPARRVSDNEMDSGDASGCPQEESRAGDDTSAQSEYRSNLPRTVAPTPADVRLEEVGETSTDKDENQTAQNGNEDREEAIEQVAEVTGPPNDPSDSNTTGLAQSGENEGQDEDEGDSISGEVILADTPKETWLNAIVFSKCETMTIGGEKQVATVMGVVKEISLLEDEDDTAVETEDGFVRVALFYTSNCEYLPDEVWQDEKKYQQLPSALLYIVQDGSEEFQIAQRWSGYEKVSRLRAQPGTNGIADESNLDEERSEPFALDHMNENDSMDEIESDEIVGISKNFVRNLCQRAQGPAPIGHLPDGRAVLWVKCDPRCLYVRMNTDEEYKSIYTNVSISGCRTPCPWGCTDLYETSTLCFDSREELHQHLRIRHDFGQLDDQVVDVENCGRLFRIPEGQLILILCKQLTSAICSESPDLLELSVRSFFRLSDILDLKDDSRGSPKKVIFGLLRGKHGTRSTLRLWSRIARLFAVESNGMFRLNENDCETFAYLGDDQAEPLRIVDVGGHDNLEEENKCLIEESSASASNKCSDCHLCGLRWDRRIKNSAETFGNGGNENIAVAGGLSCDLLCLSCRSPHLPAEYMQLKGNSGPEGVARGMLIHIASSVPSSLKRHANNYADGKAVSANGAFIWEDGNYQNWRYLVEKGHSIGSFLQAFVLLVHSLKASKLPRWFTGAREGRYGSPLSTMASSSYGYSALIFRLHVLDTAIYEYLVASTGTMVAHLEDPLPPVLRGKTTKERMKIVQGWATQTQYKKFEGTHDSVCFACNDGGDLLCCDYCSKVQHGRCHYPPITDSDREELEIWVCPACVKDLGVIAGVEDDM
jgi:hypothetical protein